MIDPVFEDDLILALNKPSGLPSQNQEDPDQDTAERRVKTCVPGSAPHLLHRLDTGTSGVLLFAKTEAVFREMRDQFRNRSITKTYVAWSLADLPSGFPDLPLRIDLPLAHHPQNRKKMIALPEGRFRSYRGKPLPAVTWIDSVRECKFSGVNLLKFKVRIETGVMHQIRVHLAHSGFPLVGDPLYGKRADAPSGFRLGLHASGVEFELHGAQYRIHAPEPETLQQIP